MHLVYMTDIHITSRNPRSRMDNYKESILRKLAYVGDFAKSLNAPVLCGGDIFHTADVSNSLVSETIKVIRQHFDAPITSIAGNHDLFGNNLQTLPKTSYGLLEASGCLYNLRPREAKTIKERRNGKWVDAVTICGYPSSYDLPDTADAYLCRPMDKYPNGVPLIQLIHGALYDRIPDNFPFAAVSVSELDVDENAADVVLSGHIHSGFPVTMSSTTGRIFANPGALGRLTTAISDVNLSVKVAVITIENGVKVEYHELPKDIALPAEQVLDLKRAAEEKQASAALSVFMQHVEAISTNGREDTQNMYQVLEQIAKEMNLSKPVYDLAIQKLQEAEEENGHEIEE